MEIKKSPKADLRATWDFVKEDLEVLNGKSMKKNISRDKTPVYAEQRTLKNKLYHQTFNLTRKLNITIINKIIITTIATTLISCGSNKQESPNEEQTVQATESKETYKEIGYLPENFLELVTTSTPLEKIKEMFGIADKMYSNKEEAYTYYFYDLQNGYLRIDTKDDKTISTISIQSKHKKPSLKIGSSCPIDFLNGKILKLGESKFNELDDKKPVEISRDKCTELGFIGGFGGRPCSYKTTFYGSIIDYEKLEIDYEKLTNETSVFFESSYGFLDNNYFKNQTIDYIIISNDEELLKKSHPYGEGIHCDIINLN